MSLLRSNRLKWRIGLWALGHALPEEEVLTQRLQAFMTGIAAVTTGSLMLSLFFAVGLGAFYLYLVDEGLQPYASLLVVGLLAAAMAAIAFLIGVRALSIAVDIKDDLAAYKGDSFSSLLNAVVSGFMDGVTDKSPKKDSLHEDDEKTATEKEEDLPVVHLRGNGHGEIKGFR